MALVPTRRRIRSALFRNGHSTNFQVMLTCDSQLKVRVLSMRIQLTLLALVSLTGCGTLAVSEYQAPDGSRIKTAKCTSEPQRCFTSASQSCPDGGSYRVISSESHAGGLLADIFPGPVTWYGMTYSCGSPDGKMPDFKFQGQQYRPPQPAPTTTIVNTPRPSTTTCNSYGSSVTCNSY